MDVAMIFVVGFAAFAVPFVVGLAIGFVWGGRIAHRTAVRDVTEHHEALGMSPEASRKLALLACRSKG